MKKLFVFIFTVILCLGTVQAVQAEQYPEGNNEWNVTFDGTSLTSNYSAADINNSLKGMEPGDWASLKFNLVNNYKTDVDWWMENEVLKTLEEQKTKTGGGGYSYAVYYYPAAGGERKTLYSSETVRGEDKDNLGMKEATEALDEDLWLEKIGSGKKAVLEIYFALDGDSQANNYQDTLGRLRVNFAVELPPEPNEKPSETARTVHRPRVIYVPNTGDNNHLWMFIAGDIIAILLMIYVAYRVRRAQKRA